MDIETMPAAQAVETLIANYGKLVFHVIYGLTADWQESQDLTQDTYVQALRAIDAARQASGAHFHAKAWLLQIAVNVVRMSRRRRSSMRVVPFSSLRKEEQEENGVESMAECAAPVQPVGFGMRVAPDPADLIAEREAVGRTMARLPETLRLCLLLSVVGGLSSHEIARTLHLGEAAVRQRLTRARKLFRRLYLQESGETIIAGSPLSPQVEARGSRITSKVQSPPDIKLNPIYPANNMAPAQVAELGDTQASGIEHVKDGMIAWVLLQHDHLEHRCLGQDTLGDGALGRGRP